MLAANFYLSVSLSGWISKIFGAEMFPSVSNVLFAYYLLSLVYDLKSEYFLYSGRVLSPLLVFRQ